MVKITVVAFLFQTSVDLYNIYLIFFASNINVKISIHKKCTKKKCIHNKCFNNITNYLDKHFQLLVLHFDCLIKEIKFMML